MNIAARQNIDKQALTLESGHLYRESLETQRRLTFLAEASKILMSSLTTDAAFNGLARLMVPVLADYCIIYSTETDSQKLVRAAHAHHNAEADRKLGKLLAESLSLSEQSPIAEAARNGCSCLYPDLDKLSDGIFNHEPNY